MTSSVSKSNVVATDRMASCGRVCKRVGDGVHMCCMVGPPDPEDMFTNASGVHPSRPQAANNARHVVGGPSPACEAQEDHDAAPSFETTTTDSHTALAGLLQRAYGVAQSSMLALENDTAGYDFDFPL